MQHLLSFCFFLFDLFPPFVIHPLYGKISVCSISSTSTLIYSIFTLSFLASFFLQCQVYISIWRCSINIVFELLFEACFLLKLLFSTLEDSNPGDAYKSFLTSILGFIEAREFSFRASVLFKLQLSAVEASTRKKVCKSFFEFKEWICPCSD